MIKEIFIFIIVEFFHKYHDLKLEDEKEKEENEEKEEEEEDDDESPDEMLLFRKIIKK